MSATTPSSSPSGGGSSWDFTTGSKQRSPRTRLAVAGWGLNPEAIAGLPADVICAPIAPYSDRCESGAIYGNREYWGCPWLERDWSSSQYYYPYNMHLSNTIAALERTRAQHEGVLLPDLAADRRRRAEDVVHQQGAVGHRRAACNPPRPSIASMRRCNYGPEAADDITAIINENEPYVCDFAECQGTPEFEAAR